MHILFITNELPSAETGGGIGAYVDTMSKVFATLGHRVTIVTSRSDFALAVENRPYARVLDVHIPGVHWYFSRLPIVGRGYLSLPLRELELSLSFRKIIHPLLMEGDIDILETVGWGDYWLAFRRILPPIVFRIHGLAYEFIRHTTGHTPPGALLNLKMQVTVAKTARAITAPSDFALREFRGHLRHPGFMRVIPNPVAPWLLERGSQSLPGGVQDATDGGTVLFTGRIERRKGMLPFLRSVPLVANRFPSVQYVLCGAPHGSINNGMLEQLLHQDRTRDYVRMLGHVPWRHLPEWYSRATVYVMPSYYETFGISVLEAMAFGLPVVATRASALPEIVEDGVTGILVPAGDEQAVADAISHLLGDPALRRRMGQAGRERVQEEYTADRIATQTLKLYEQILN